MTRRHNEGLTKCKDNRYGTFAFYKLFCSDRTGISYTLQGDYYLPDLKLPEQDDRPIVI